LVDTGFRNAVVRRLLSLSVMAPAYLAVGGLPVGLQRSSSSAVFCHIKDVRCEVKIQQLWRQVFLQLQVRSCGTAFHLNCDKVTLAFNDLSGY